MLEGAAPGRQHGRLVSHAHHAGQRNPQQYRIEKLAHFHAAASRSISSAIAATSSAVQCGQYSAQM